MLQIDRLSLQVRAAAAPERAERLARRLRDAAVQGIERDRYALSPPGAPAYLFVDRVAVHCAVSADWDDAAIGAEVARALAAGLERSAAALEPSAAAPQTLAFRDRAELLAAFYSALAEGRAWERWWLEAFDGLRPLSASAALRTSVINEDAHGVAALARLTETSLSNVLSLLTAGDAKRLREWFGERRSTVAAPVASLWKASAALPARSDDNAALLRALVAAERAAPGAAGADALRMLRAMAALRAAAARGDLREVDFLIKPAHEALRAAIVKLSMKTDWLDRLGESEAQRIVEEMASILNQNSSSTANEATPEQAAPAAAPERLFTPRGGAFVLLKALEWLGWPPLWRAQLKSADADALVRALAWAVVLRALAPRSTSQGFGDPALQACFEVERPVALLRARRREVHTVLKSGISQTAEGLLAEFAKRIPGLAGASPGYLRRNALALPATLQRAGRVVRLGRAPLDILLVLAGAKSGRLALPGGAALELRAEGAA